MVQTRTARVAQARLAAASRDHGPDNPITVVARRAYRTARLCSQILTVRAELSTFNSAELNALFAAADGREVSVSA